jgi:hypothetical protein
VMKSGVQIFPRGLPDFIGQTSADQQTLDVLRISLERKNRLRRKGFPASPVGTGWTKIFSSALSR